MTRLCICLLRTWVSGVHHVKLCTWFAKPRTTRGLLTNGRWWNPTYLHRLTFAVTTCSHNTVLHYALLTKWNLVAAWVEFQSIRCNIVVRIVARRTFLVTREYVRSTSCVSQSESRRGASTCHRIKSQIYIKHIGYFEPWSCMIYYITNLISKRNYKRAVWDNSIQWI